MILTLVWSAVIGVVAALLAWAIHWLSARAKGAWLRRLGIGTAIALGLVSSLPILLSLYMSLFLIVGQPQPEDRLLRPGVRYRRSVLTEPRRAVVHILDVDLREVERIVATGPAVGTKSRALTGTEAIESLNCDVALNANFFYPFREKTPVDFSPHSGGLVQVLGEAIGEGRRFGQTEGDWITFWSCPDGRVGFGDAPPDADAAIAGLSWLVRDGEVKEKPSHDAYCRTAIGLSRDRTRLWLAVVDGKQPSYSRGLTLHELAEWLRGLGVDAAIQLDGGGSSTLAIRDPAGHPTLLNRPCHTKIPGRQRPVANFLGLRFRRRS